MHTQASNHRKTRASGLGLAGLLAVALTLVGAFPAGWAQEGDESEAPARPLPDPLTLEYVLSMPLDGHFRVMAGRADRDRAEARLKLAESEFMPRVDLHARLRHVKPNPVAENQDEHDNALILSARQPVYDFGRRSANRDSAERLLGAREQDLVTTQRHHRLKIMQAYFDVLLADQAYTVTNEEMAIVFVNLDKMRDRHELGMISDVELAEREQYYQSVLLERSRRDADRRQSRRALAELLGRPESLPSRLAMPDLSALLTRELLPVNELIDSLLSGDPKLQALQLEYEAASRRVDAARAANLPEIYLEIDAGEYSRELGSRDRFRGGLYLDIPLYRGGSTDAQIGAAQSERMRIQAHMAERSALLREQALALYEEIRILDSVAADRIEALDVYSDLNFVRKQTLYDMEKATDLGDAMVQLSRARLERMEVDFARALAWAQIHLLQGRDYAQFLSAEGR
ncbi:MAG: TolC family protein [Halothiobacillaceae bacterium]